MTEQQDTTQSPRPIVYVRRIAAADLPDDVRRKVGPVEALYAIGSEEGEQLALVKDRTLAFAVARQNEMTPVSVH